MRRTLTGGLVALALLGGVAPVVAGAHPSDALDTDHDGFRDVDDNCPDAFNRGQDNTDGDGGVGPLAGNGLNEGGDACDIDDDGDGVDDAVDTCQLVADREQRDTDADGLGDLCDEDDDGDGVPDQDDNCIKQGNAGQDDADGDFIGDLCDPDGAPRPLRPTAVPLGRRDPSDKRAPVVRLSVPARIAADEIAGGVPVALTCDEACGVDGELRATGTVARRLGSKRAVLAVDRAAVAGAGTTYVFLRPSKVVRTRLAQQRRAVALQLTFEVVDASGNLRTLRRTLRVHA